MSGTVQNPTDDDEEKVTETEETEVTATETEAKKPKSYTEEEWTSLDARMRAADKNRSETQKKLEAAEARLAEIDQANMTELQKLQAENEKLKQKTQGLSQKMKDQALENAFLATPGVEWADKEDAYTVLRTKYLEGVEIDEDGKVSGMKEAVAAMAKGKPHLVKTAAEEVIQPSSEATGETPKKRKGEKTTADRASLAKRFPALKK